MIKKEASSQISSGVVHKIPTDLREILTHKQSVLSVWQDITPLARNEWICWISSAKKLETRNRRIRIMCENLVAGKRRPCCWAGCAHR
jgi:uncharacterized protein YdeI (YjbR/CyaY-like superfamily)